MPPTSRNIIIYNIQPHRRGDTLLPLSRTINFIFVVIHLWVTVRRADYYASFIVCMFSKQVKRNRDDGLQRIYKILVLQNIVYVRKYFINVYWSKITYNIFYKYMFKIRVTLSTFFNLILLNLLIQTIKRSKNQKPSQIYHQAKNL